VPLLQAEEKPGGSVTTRTITAYTCDACGKQEHDAGEPSSCWNPVRWAQVEWSDPPEDGKKHNQWKRMDLCPDHLNLFLKWVAEEQEKRTLSAG
jgi:hypothetical protein